jgi:hypothetical protein
MEKRLISTPTYSKDERDTNKALIKAVSEEKEREYKLPW